MSLLKKIITAMLVASMIFTLSSITVSALTEESTEQQLMLGSDVPEGDSLPDSNELLMGYLEQDIYPSVSLFGRSAYSLLNDNEKMIYNHIKTAILEIAAGTRTSTAVEITTNLENFSWTASELGLSTLSSNSNATQNAIINAIGQKITTGDIMRALIADIPCEMFWFDKTAGMQTSYAPIIQGSTAKVSKFVFYFKVSTDFAGSAQYTTSASLISPINTAKQNAKAIVDKYESKTDIEKLTAYSNEICDITNYYSGNINNVNYGNPWQIIWVFDDNPLTEVVCEGYSKAFKYLCDLSSFSSSVYCYTVTGEMTTQNISGPHMWNLVEIGGKNYLVDVTNSDDGSIGDNGSLFMVGATSFSNGAIHRVGNTVTYSYDTQNIGNYLEDGVFLPVSQTPYSYDALNFNTVLVLSGAGSGNYSTGVTVTITANEEDDENVFEYWIVSSENVILDDPYSATTTFVMPNENVIVSAIYHVHSIAEAFSYDESHHWYEYTCGCDEIFFYDAHVYEQNVITHPSCFEDGKIQFSCECGYSYEESTPMLEHDYNDGIITKEPTTAESGEKTFTCINCKTSYSEQIPFVPENSTHDDTDIDNTSNNNSSSNSELQDQTEDTQMESERVEESRYNNIFDTMDEYGCQASVSSVAVAAICALCLTITSKRKKD